MIISYNFNCPWNFQKKERISQLLSERILLLSGFRMFQKIVRINFCEKELIEKGLAENNLLLLDHEYAGFHIVEGSFAKTYELVLEKNILISMLTPGVGQSHFDNLILKFKEVI